MNHHYDWIQIILQQIYEPSSNQHFYIIGLYIILEGLYIYIYVIIDDLRLISSVDCKNELMMAMLC